MAISCKSLAPFSAVIVALASIVQTSQVHISAATHGEFGTELGIMAAVVLGGTNLMGGNGSITRTLIGGLFSWCHKQWHEYPRCAARYSAYRQRHCHHFVDGIE